MHNKILCPTDENIANIAQRLCAGEIIAIPTETVYGLAVRADSNTAVSHVYHTKSRPSFNPLIIHCRDIEHVKGYGILNEFAQKLYEAFSPGPLTLVLDKVQGAPVCDLVTAGLDTIAVRIPRHPVIQQVLAECDFALAAPSANKSESISPTSAGHVHKTLPDITVLDGGECEEGLESTILRVTLDNQVYLLRPGSITAMDVFEKTGIVVQKSTSNKIESPGQTKRHYSPDTPLRMNVTKVLEGEVLLGFGSHAMSINTNELNLSPTGDLNEAAKNLFSYLHRLDDLGARGIAVVPIPDEGLGVAINDRLRRAASSHQE